MFMEIEAELKHLRKESEQRDRTDLKKTQLNTRSKYSNQN